MEQWNQTVFYIHGVPLAYRVRRVSPVQTQEQGWYK